MSSSTHNPRLVKLTKLFHGLISGKEKLSQQNYKLFLESVCAQPDSAACIEKLLFSGQGLSCLQASLRFDLTSAFLNGPADTLLHYLSSSDVASISGGDFLQRILLTVVDPPIFWSAFKRAFVARELEDHAQESFAWLLLQLIQLPGNKSVSFLALAQDDDILNQLLKSSSLPVRTTAQRIKLIAETLAVGSTVEEYGPGGRHDNDFVNFRNISILPTADELMSTQFPYLRASATVDDPDSTASRVATHLDNQFRLLREDMLYEMREELQVALGMKKGKYRGLVIDGLKLIGIHHESNGKLCKWGLVMQCQNDFWQLKKLKPADRKKHLADNRQIFKHGSLTCLLIDDQVTAFPSVDRDEDLLSHKPPIVVLRVDGPESTAFTLSRLLSAEKVKLLQIDTAVFAYEPVLSALKRINQLRLSDEILHWTPESVLIPPPNQPVTIIQEIRTRSHEDIQRILGTPNSVVLDTAQTEALLGGLTQRLSLIQGPPGKHFFSILVFTQFLSCGLGTGKSFVGALLAKIIHDTSCSTILVVCYTNHALDQFLEDLLNIGIPAASLVRLGGKSTPNTEPFLIQKLLSNRGNYPKFGKADWAQMNGLKASATELRDDLVSSFNKYQNFNPQPHEILEHLEFEAPTFWTAFKVPDTDDGMEMVGKGGQKVGSSYLYDQWRNGKDAGIFRDSPSVKETSHIWRMTPQARKDQLARWKEEMVRELIERISAVSTEYNDTVADIDRKYNEKVAAILQSKRIVGCTTTAAAKYRDDIKEADPDVLLVEEAGEILESHILTALGPRTQQLILIGDHK